MLSQTLLQAPCDEAAALDAAAQPKPHVMRGAQQQQIALPAVRTMTTMMTWQAQLPGGAAAVGVRSRPSPVL